MNPLNTSPSDTTPAAIARLHIEDSGGGRPVVLIHGEADAIVPIESSGQRTHRAVLHSKLVTVSGAPQSSTLTRKIYEVC